MVNSSCFVLLVVCVSFFKGIQGCYGLFQHSRIQVSIIILSDKLHRSVVIIMIPSSTSQQSKLTIKINV